MANDGTLAAADDKTVQVVATSLSSASNQSFLQGNPPTAAAVMTVTESPTAAAITAALDIRIRIPAGFPMSWDTADTTAVIGGGAAGKVSPTVTYEDAGKTLVLDVTSDFAPADAVTIAGLQFRDFTAFAPLDNLELEVFDDGQVTATDDKTIAVTPLGPTISSTVNQVWFVGDPPSPISTIHVAAGSGPPNIDINNDIRIRIPAGFNMSWDQTDTSPIIGGPAAGKVQQTTSLAFEDGFMTIVLDVLANFVAGGFTAPSPPDNLELDVLNNDTNADTDDKIIVIQSTTEVELLSFTATAGDSVVDLSWTTASELDNLGFHLYRGLDPAGPYERLTSSLIPGLGSSPTGTSYGYRDSGLLNGTQYFYLLEDVETTGHTERHGPVSATPQAGGGEEGSGGGGAEGGEGSDTPGEDPSRISYGDPGAPSLRVLERGPLYVLLELVTPGFVAFREDDGSMRIEIPSFEEAGQPGAPAVPVRRALVEAVAGRRVRVAGTVAEEVVTFDSMRLAAAGAPEVVVDELGTVRAGKARRRLLDAHRRGGYYPRHWARLIDTVFQGETKKARLELAPLRHDPGSERLLLARRLLVRLEFLGRDPEEAGLGGSRGRRAPVIPRLSRGLVAQVMTKQAGLYRLRFEDVFGASRRGVLASSLRLSRQGQAVAYHLEPDRALFGPGSTLFFLSEGEAANPWGDAVYELELGRPASRMAVISGPPSGPAVSEYLESRSLEKNKFYQAALLEAPDLWLWDLLVSPVTKTYALEVDQLSPSSTPSHLRVVLQGASDFPNVIDHHLRLSLNGVPLAEVTFDGKVEQVVEAEISPGVLVEGTNTLALENVGDAGAAYSMVFLNRLSLTYPRRLQASSGRLEGLVEQSGQAEVAGLSSPSFVVDTTAAPMWLKGLSPVPGGVSFRAELGHRYLAVSESALGVPEVRRPLSRTLRRTTNRADWLLIAPKEFLPAAQPLLEQRRQQGLVSKAVSLEDVAAEFGHGESTPKALRDFLVYAYQSWRRPSPRYVVLLGDSTYDPKNYLGTSVKDRLPTPIVKTSYLWTASDPALASVNGDDLLPDLAIGRLSAGSLEQATRLVQKLLAYEQAGRSLAGTAVLVADNADIAGNFEADLDEIASSLLAGREVEKVYFRDLGAATRTTIKAALDNGPALLSYVGHGSTAVWASENVWNNTDLAALASQGQQPLLLTLNCLNGFFHFPPLDSLAEAFVKAEGKGAIAAFSPSGLSVNHAAHLYHKALLEEIETGTHQRLGDALLAAQKTYADSGAMPELLSIYHLFGDPALRIR